MTEELEIDRLARMRMDRWMRDLDARCDRLIYMCEMRGWGWSVLYYSERND